MKVSMPSQLQKERGGYGNSTYLKLLPLGFNIAESGWVGIKLKGKGQVVEARYGRGKSKSHAQCVVPQPPVSSVQLGL